jgi:hypothetical protein
MLWLEAENITLTGSIMVLGGSGGGGGGPNGSGSSGGASGSGMGGNGDAATSTPTGGGGGGASPGVVVLRSHATGGSLTGTVNPQASIRTSSF